MKESLLSALRKLRLSGLSETLEVRLGEAASHNLSHAEFLELILQDELTVRQERLVDRRVKAAGFRELKPLDQFDWAFNPSIKKKQVYDLATCRFIRESREYLFEIIMRRYETRSTIMTSNRPLEDWGKLIGDIPSATAILDRFLHHAEIITITGRSYRLRNQGRQDGQAHGDQEPPKEGTRPRRGPAQAPAGE